MCTLVIMAGLSVGNPECSLDIARELYTNTCSIDFNQIAEKYGSSKPIAICKS